MSKNLISRLNAATSSSVKNGLNLNLKSANEQKPIVDLEPKIETKNTVLYDLFGRHHTYLRVSLTERCNLRCTYCMPEEGVKLTANEKMLTGSEIVRLINFFANLGVNKVRFTGGEPLVRKDCVDIIREVGKIQGLKKIAMTSNGITLAKKLKDLKEAGLNQLNISLDTLEEKKFEFIAKRNGWSKVMQSIEAALEIGYSPLKINCVVMKGINDDEINNFIEFTKDKNVDVRFIEYMPFDGNKWNTKKMVSYREMLKIVAQKYPLEHINKLQDDPNDTSKQYIKKAFKIDNYKGQFGFITSMSEHFCNTCNRIRLTADGNLKVCLFGNAEISLRDAIRNNMNEDDLKELISSAIKRKKEKHAGMNNLPNMKNRPMILIDNRSERSFSIKNHLYINSKLNKFPSKLYSNYSYQSLRLYTNHSSSGYDKNDSNFYEEQNNHWNEFKKFYEQKQNESRQIQDDSLLSNKLTHFDNQTDLPKQVDISDKKLPDINKPIRVACASGYIQLNEETFNALIENKLKKGNALVVSQIAGIQASKQTSNLIPLCHQILLDVCDVKFYLDNENFRIKCEAICKTSTSKTGVEMEALTSCSIALLTIYDMCKAIQKDAIINDIKLEYKFGGKSNFKRNN